MAFSSRSRRLPPCSISRSRPTKQTANISPPSARRCSTRPARSPRQLRQFRRWCNGRAPLRKPLARYGALWWRALLAACLGEKLLRGKAVVPQNDGANESESGEPAPHHGETTVNYYAGIDVSLECSSVCVVDGDGKI